MMGFRGLLLTSATGAKIQWMPSARASRAAIRPSYFVAARSFAAPNAMLCGNRVPPVTRMEAARSKSEATRSGVFASLCIWFRNSGQGMRLGIAHQAVLRGVVNNDAADVQVGDPVAVLFVIGRLGAVDFAIGGDDHQLRDFIAQAHRLHQRLHGALFGGERRGFRFRGLRRCGDGCDGDQECGEQPSRRACS